MRTEIRYSSQDSHFPKELNWTDHDMLTKLSYSDLFHRAIKQNMPYYTIAVVSFIIGNKRQYTICDAVALNHSSYLETCKNILEKIYYFAIPCFEFNFNGNGKKASVSLFSPEDQSPFVLLDDNIMPSFPFARRLCETKLENMQQLMQLHFTALNFFVESNEGKNVVRSTQRLISKILKEESIETNSNGMSYIRFYESTKWLWTLSSSNEDDEELKSKVNIRFRLLRRRFETEQEIQHVNTNDKK